MTLAEACRERDVWLHVDAAYGGFAALVDRGRELLRGIDLADSVTLDPHKLLYQSYECGGLLVREPDALRSAFEIVPPYLRDTRGREGEVNLGDHGIQLSRTSHAFKLWLSIRDLRTRRVPARDRPLVGPRRARRTCASGKATSWSSSLRRRSGSCASAVVPRGWTTRSSSRD